MFTFSLLTIAFVGLGSPGVKSQGLADKTAAREGLGDRLSVVHPGWSIVCLGVAGTQNLPIAVLVPLSIVFLVLTRAASFRDRRFIVLCLVGLFLAALPLGYYGLQTGRLIPLSVATHGRVPNLDELTAVVRDTNIGLIANAPTFALAVVLAVGFLLVRSPRCLLGADTGLSLCAAAVFLASFAETTNFNHGGTPGMSRYVLWLIPLPLPFLRRFGDARQSLAPQQSMALLAAVSCVWSVVAFRPEWAEEYGKPTRLASWLWTNYPWLDRPLPEVFIERLYGADVAWWLPAFTPQCEKILLTGRGTDVPMWPIPCPPPHRFRHIAWNRV